MGAGWALTDYFQPMDGGDENPRFPLASGADVRVVLTRLAGMAPRVAVLEGPAGQVLQVGVGGPWAGFARIEAGAPSGGRPPRIRTALPRAAAAPGPVAFLRWAQPCSLPGDALFPAAEAIEVIAGYVESGAFPPWVGWRE